MGIEALVASQGFWAIAGTTVAGIMTLVGTLLANRQKYHQEIKTKTREEKITRLNELFYFANCLLDFVAVYHRNQISGDDYFYPDVSNFCVFCRNYFSSEMELFVASEGDPFNQEISDLKLIYDKMKAEQNEFKELENIGYVPTSIEDTVFSADLRMQTEKLIKDFAPRLREWCILKRKELNS